MKVQVLAGVVVLFLTGCHGERPAAPGTAPVVGTQPQPDANDAMGKAAEARRFATELVERTRHLEDVYERLDAIVVAHAALADPALAADALAMAQRLDARIEKKRHVAATREALRRTHGAGAK